MTGPADRYEFVGYGPEFKEPILALQTLLWSPRLAVNATYFEWKYEQNPYVRDPHIYLALWRGEVVAMRGLFGTRWEAGSSGAALSALCSDDLVIAPEHRGRGLLTGIMKFAQREAAAEGFTHLLNLSASPTTRLASLAAGWGHVGPVPRMRRESGPSSRRGSVCGTRGQGTDTPGSSWRPFHELDRYRRRHGDPIGPHVTISDTPRPAAMAELVRRLGHDGRIRHVRDESYFAWRFRDPLSTYRFFFLEGETLEGYLVLQAAVESRHGTFVRLADWEGPAADARAALLDAVLQVGDPEPIEIWTGTLPEQSLAALRRAGFEEVEVQSLADSFPTVLIRPLRDVSDPCGWLFEGRDLRDLSSWDLRLLYSPES